MWSSAALAHLLQGSTCCAFRDGILHTLVVMSGYLSYCCLFIISTFTFTISHFADAFIQNDLQLGNT